jgi:hypothetical protein
MIEIDVSQWDFFHWRNVVVWCTETFDRSDYGQTWLFSYESCRLWLSEKNLTVFMLRWG